MDAGLSRSRSVAAQVLNSYLFTFRVPTRSVRLPGGKVRATSVHHLRTAVSIRASAQMHPRPQTRSPRSLRSLRSLRLNPSPLPSALCRPPSALCPLPSALCPPPSALRPLPSALCPPPSAIAPPSDHLRTAVSIRVSAQMHPPPQTRPFRSLRSLRSLRLNSTRLTYLGNARPPPSALCPPPSALCPPPSALRPLPSPRQVPCSPSTATFSPRPSLTLAERRTLPPQRGSPIPAQGKRGTSAALGHAPAKILPSPIRWERGRGEGPRNTLSPQALRPSPWPRLSAQPADTFWPSGRRYPLGYGLPAVAPPSDHLRTAAQVRQTIAPPTPCIPSVPFPRPRITSLTRPPTREPDNPAKDAPNHPPQAGLPTPLSRCPTQANGLKQMAVNATFVTTKSAFNAPEWREARACGSRIGENV